MNAHMLQFVGVGLVFFGLITGFFAAESRRKGYEDLIPIWILMLAMSITLAFLLPDVAQYGVK